MERRPFTFPLPDKEMVGVGWWFDVSFDGAKVGRGTVEKITDDGVRGAIEFFGKAPEKERELHVSAYRHPEQKNWDSGDRSS
jgi:hypothetical protein